MFDWLTVVSTYFNFQLPPLAPNIFFCFSDHQVALFFFLLLSLQPCVLQWQTRSWGYFTSGIFYVRKNYHFLSSFRENSNVIVFPFPFHIPLQGRLPIVKTRSCPDLYPFIRPPRRPLVLGRGRILIPWFIRFPPRLSVFDFAHSLPLGGKISEEIVHY